MRFHSIQFAGAVMTGFGGIKKPAMGSQSINIPPGGYTRPTGPGGSTYG